jgi:2'-5' RNA ligase
MHWFYLALMIEKSSPRDWLEKTRLRFDPKAELVPPHVTVVFPTVKLSEEEMASEALSLLVESKSFTMSFSEVRIVNEEESGLVSLFLIVDNGFEEVVELHRRLYSGRLAGELRREKPYLPHVTLGTGLSRGIAEACVAELKSEDIRFSVKVDSLTLVRIVDDRDSRLLIRKIEFL